MTRWHRVGPRRWHRELGHRTRLVVVRCDNSGTRFLALMVHGTNHALWSSVIFSTERDAKRSATRAALKRADDMREALGATC